MRRGRSLPGAEAPNGSLDRSEVDPTPILQRIHVGHRRRRSRVYASGCVGSGRPRRARHPERASRPPAHRSSTRRARPRKRGTVGEEMYGVICDRVGAQALREDLTRRLVPRRLPQARGGSYADKVDDTKLPAARRRRRRRERQAPSRVDKQQADRDNAVGARRGARAPPRRSHPRVRRDVPRRQKIAIKDIDNADPSEVVRRAEERAAKASSTSRSPTCSGRMGDLYNDGTLPQSTESLARVIDAFKKYDEAQAAWAAPQRAPGLPPDRDRARRRAADHRLPAPARSLEREPPPPLGRLDTRTSSNPKRDADGNRIPVPGPGNAALNKMLEAAHEELLAREGRPEARPARRTTTRRRRARRPLAPARQPRDDRGDPLRRRTRRSAAALRAYIVRRDPRGYATIRGGAVPAPFVDADKDGLPDVDESVASRRRDSSLAPSPFPYPGRAASDARSSPAARLAGARPPLRVHRHEPHVRRADDDGPEAAREPRPGQPSTRR